MTNLGITFKGDIMFVYQNKNMNASIQFIVDLIVF